MLALRQSLFRSSLSIQARQSQSISRGIVLSRGYATTPHMNDGNADTIQEEKEKTVKGGNKSSVEHAPGWNESLASQSEAKVKADQNPKGPEELQSETSKVAEIDHPHGEATDSRADGSTGARPKNI